jgi:hypothetical protein
MECECAKVFFDLREVSESGQPIPAGLSLKIHVDGDTWREIDPPPRDALAAQIVQEFLDGHPASAREHLQRRIREKRHMVRRLRDYRISPDLMERGLLIAFGEIICDRRHGGATASSFAYEWEHDGVFYLLDDLYCPNPACHCRDVRVSFFRCVPSSGPRRGLTMEERFSAIVTLDGKWRIADCDKCTEAEAKELLRAWRRDEPDHLETFRWRYQKVKEIAQRGFRRRIRLPQDEARPRELAFEPPAELPFDLPADEIDEAGDQPASSGVRVGRNEPCPCGSGKKYKKCCGRG